MAEFQRSENDTKARLCANNCGFYGSSENRNLCSKCFADFLRNKLISISTESGEDSQQTNNQESDLVTKQASPLASSSRSVNSESIEASKAAGGKSRCAVCRKKVGLLGFKCRCEGLFCGRHRFPEEHRCGVVDYKAMGKVILAKQNVECKGDKLQFRV